MKSEAGFSLIEVMVAMAVLLIVMFGLLQGLVLASQVFLFVEERFQGTLDRWNGAQSLYPNFDPTATSLRPCPSCLPVNRSIEGTTDRAWEVFHGR
ncbi:MAG TPA: prepilin-type N-terminal cleavage/methylation domain-containing protein [Acidobacteriota bacterium]|nr:prepilin-type N-terminal cleavage/methylation domain-containing protein [Acidobacteriota bacterium]